jgi:phosphohistidine phosphatase
MKKLYIVRHAKSSWEHPELPDEQRPLIEKGLRRTKRINDYFIEHGIVVDLIISSPAVRAFETAKIVGKALKHKEKEIKIDSLLYAADANRLFNLFYDLPAGVDSLMIVGHNPTLTNFANHFIVPKIDSLPTSGVVCIEFKVDKWEEISSLNGTLKFFITPKMLKEQAKRK